MQTRERVILDLRAIGIPEVPMLGRYNNTRARRGLLEHAHPGSMEICFLVKGTQLYRLGRRDYVLRGGDLFVTFPGEEHSTGEAPEEKGTLYWLILDLTGRSGQFLNCPPADSSKLVAQLLAIPHRHFAGEPALQPMLEEIIRAARSGNDPLRNIYVRVKLVEYLLKILECSRVPSKTGLSDGINSLLRHIESILEEPLTVGELAAHTGLSVSRFKTRFKKEIGIPPAEYVLRRKVSRAKELLVFPSTMVTDVAFRLGFSSSQYFATVFKRYTGKNPRAFLAHS